MIVNNNVNSPSFNALMIKKTPKNIDLLHKLRHERPDWFLEIQKAGEILGAPGSQNSTKHYELMIDELNHFGYWSDLRPYIKVNKNAYWGSFNNGEYYGDTYTLRGKEALSIRTRNHGYICDLHKDTKTKNVSAFNNFTLGIEECLLIAKVLKIMDNLSGIKNSGSKELLKEVNIPEKKKLMSVWELIEKYGVDD